jgi:hypothetical protein
MGRTLHLRHHAEHGHRMRPGSAEVCNAGFPTREPAPLCSSVVDEIGPAAGRAAEPIKFHHNKLVIGSNEFTAHLAAFNAAS